MGPITHLFSSDYQQAYKTAEAIRNAAPSLDSRRISVAKPEIIQFAELREKEFSTREGDLSSLITPNNENPPLEEANHRAKRFLNAVLIPLLKDLLQFNTLQSVVVVAHGGIHSHIWLQFIFALKQLGVSLNFDSGTTRLERVPLDEFLANAGYHEMILKSPRASATVSGLQVADEGSARQALSGVEVHIRALNYTDHLLGLKKTGGGIGDAKFDAKQTTIESFFGPKSRT